ncbi:MAG: TldD/PmbA family protein [Myxococcota bacterium]
MRSVLRDALAFADGFVELRYHNKVSRRVSISQGRLENSITRRQTGVAVRVIVDGTWGFSSTDDISLAGIRAAIRSARVAAGASAAFRRARLPTFSRSELTTGDFVADGVKDVLDRTIEDRVALAMEMHDQARKASAQIRSVQSFYNEFYEQKAIVTTDGADVSTELIRPEIGVYAVAERDGEMRGSKRARGVTGDWRCLFHQTPAELAERAARDAVDLLSARPGDGGRTTVILSPSLVGLLVHEAIGHTVEADLVEAGSVAKGRTGQRVASELVTLCDSGLSERIPGAGGSLSVDDEGVRTRRTVIIDRGILKSYLHDRESAARMGVTPTGNARAWSHTDRPLIRMRNTYIEPGDSRLDDMIASTEDGYFLDGPRNGQADVTGEFMFGVSRARRIKNGKLGEMVRGLTVTGQAFDVLSTVDAISNEFEWALGSGMCGKGQPAKVDAGGPYLRCNVLLGGRQ